MERLENGRLVDQLRELGKVTLISRSLVAGLGQKSVIIYVVRS